MKVPDAVGTLERDLRDIFGNRMQSLVVYAAADRSVDLPSLVVVSAVTAEDLRACAARVAAWHDASLATPLVLEAGEFARSLDAFPFEFGAILATHTVIAGPDPFADARVDRADVRRACEVQVRSHLLHLREGFIDTEGRGDRLADLIARSAGPLAALVQHVKRLDAEYLEPSVFERVIASAASPMASDEARLVFPDYLEAVSQLTARIDTWGGA